LPVIEEINHYQLLKVTNQASQDEIRRSFKKMVLKYHPDVNPDKENREYFKKVVKAYSILKNRETRLHYDQRVLRKNSSGFPFQFDLRPVFNRHKAFAHKIQLFFKGLAEWDESMWKMEKTVPRELMEMPVSELEERLRFSGNVFVRLHAVLALGYKKERKSSALLEEKLETEEARVQKAIIWALSKLKMRKVLSIYSRVFSGLEQDIQMMIINVADQTSGLNNRMLGRFFNHLLMDASEDQCEKILEIFLRRKLLPGVDQLKKLKQHSSLTVKILTEQVANNVRLA